VLIESQGPSWFYGTASEHSVLYQYELNNAKNIYMSMIQTESPYFQPSPQAPAPFGPSLGQFQGDFDFRDCPIGNNTGGCATSWGLRIVDSADVVIGGAGLYSWFNNYDRSCVDQQQCQNGIISSVMNSGLWFYNIITIGAVQMVTPMGTSLSAKSASRVTDEQAGRINSQNTSTANRAAITLGARPSPDSSTPTDSTTVITSTVIVTPVPVASCPPNYNPIRPRLDPVFAIPNTVMAADPFVSIIIAWLLENFVLKGCYVEAGPVKDIFAMMGDSFATGIGAGKSWLGPDVNDRCRRGDMSVGSQLFLEPNWWWNSREYHRLDFIACSGTKSSHMFKDGPGFKELQPQDKLFNLEPNDAAVLWVGGNDIKFRDILDGCVYNFYGPFSTGCSEAFRFALQTIQGNDFRQNLAKVYTEVLQGSHPKLTHFTLYVLGYPRYWNQVTDDCDKSRFWFWRAWSGPELTKDNRKDMNDLTLELNKVIKDVVTRVGGALVGDSRRIMYIDTDPVFEGHRFCEPGSTEPNPNNPNNYFFQLYDQDLSPDGKLNDNLPFWPNSSSVGAASLPNADSCKTALQGDSLDWGDAAACEIALVLQQNSGLSLRDSNYPQALGSDFSGAAYNRVFHPKSKGYSLIKDLIMATIQKSK
jgi:hypothetical protein